MRGSGQRVWPCRKDRVVASATSMASADPCYICVDPCHTRADPRHTLWPTVCHIWAYLAILCGRPFAIFGPSSPYFVADLLPYLGLPRWEVLPSSAQTPATRLGRPSAPGLASTAGRCPHCAARRRLPPGASYGSFGSGSQNIAPRSRSRSRPHHAACRRQRPVPPSRLA